MKKKLTYIDPYKNKNGIKKMTIDKSKLDKAPQKFKDKMYMLYAMVMIAEGLCLDTKQMGAYDALCEMRLKVNGSEEHGDLSDHMYEIYKQLGYSDITLLPHLLYFISAEAKKLKEIFLSVSPLSDFTNEKEAKIIKSVALDYFINFEIVKLIQNTNINILNSSKYKEL